MVEASGNEPLSKQFILKTSTSLSGKKEGSDSFDLGYFNSQACISALFTPTLAHQEKLWVNASLNSSVKQLPCWFLLVGFCLHAVK